MEAHNNDQLQILTAKTWDLHVRINEKISQDGFSLCSHCSNQGRYCVVSESNVEEREKMMAIRDSLKELHNILLYLQRVNTRHKIESDEALARLEESRKMLVERINQCSKMERNDEVLEEVITFIGDGKSNDEFPWNLKMEKIDDEIKKNNVNGVSRFLVRTTRFGLEFVAIFACIYTSVRFCESRKQNHRLQNDARGSMMGRSEFLLSGCSENIDLDVLYGRG